MTDQHNRRRLAEASRLLRRAADNIDAANNLEAPTVRAGAIPPALDLAERNILGAKTYIATATESPKSEGN